MVDLFTLSLTEPNLVHHKGFSFTISAFHSRQDHNGKCYVLPRQNLSSCLARTFHILLHPRSPRYVKLAILLPNKDLQYYTTPLNLGCEPPQKQAITASIENLKKSQTYQVCQLNGDGLSGAGPGIIYPIPRRCHIYYPSPPHTPSRIN